MIGWIRFTLNLTPIEITFGFKFWMHWMRIRSELFDSLWTLIANMNTIVMKVEAIETVIKVNINIIITLSPVSCADIIAQNPPLINKIEKTCFDQNLLFLSISPWIWLNFSKVLIKRWVLFLCLWLVDQYFKCNKIFSPPFLHWFDNK